ncbi:unnamed protein product [marine sediment metagenome]|uniref:Uncharacterized protein n=1 Tax=marine sediment metagenome TaxID=412755 RepID=X1JEZ9_9ZZZZ
MKEENKKHYVECECGIRVYGRTKEHAKKLLPAHKRSKRHKDIIEIKERSNIK